MKSHGGGARGGHFASPVQRISASGFSPQMRNISIVEYRPEGNDPSLANPLVSFRLASVYVFPGDVDQNGLLEEQDLNELTQRGAR